jgi:hypothetical protein
MILFITSSMSSFALADGLSLSEDEKIKLAGNIMELKSENIELNDHVDILEGRIVIERKEADDVIGGLEKENNIKDRIIKNKNRELQTTKVKTVFYIGTAAIIGYLVGNL